MALARKRQICLSNTKYYHCVSVVLDAPFYAEKMHSQVNHMNTAEDGLKSACLFSQRYFVLMCVLMP